MKIKEVEEINSNNFNLVAKANSYYFMDKYKNNIDPYFIEILNYFKENNPDKICPISFEDLRDLYAINNKPEKEIYSHTNYKNIKECINTLKSNAHNSDKYSELSENRNSNLEKKSSNANSQSSNSIENSYLFWYIDNTSNINSQSDNSIENEHSYFSHPNDINSEINTINSDKNNIHKFLHLYENESNNNDFEYNINTEDFFSNFSNINSQNSDDIKEDIVLDNNYEEKVSKKLNNKTWLICYFNYIIENNKKCLILEKIKNEIKPNCILNYCVSCNKRNTFIYIEFKNDIILTENNKDNYSFENKLPTFYKFDKLEYLSSICGNTTEYFTNLNYFEDINEKIKEIINYNVFSNCSDISILNSISIIKKYPNSFHRNNIWITEAYDNLAILPVKMVFDKNYYIKDINNNIWKDYSNQDVVIVKLYVSPKNIPGLKEFKLLYKWSSNEIFTISVFKEGKDNLEFSFYKTLIVICNYDIEDLWKANKELSKRLKSLFTCRSINSVNEQFNLNEYLQLFSLIN